MDHEDFEVQKYLELGLFCLSRGLVFDARQSWRKVLEIEPSNALSLDYLRSTECELNAYDRRREAELAADGNDDDDTEEDFRDTDPTEEDFSVSGFMLTDDEQSGDAFFAEEEEEQEPVASPVFNPPEPITIEAAEAEADDLHADLFEREGDEPAGNVSSTGGVDASSTGWVPVPEDDLDDDAEFSAAGDDFLQPSPVQVIEAPPDEDEDDDQDDDGDGDDDGRGGDREIPEAPGVLAGAPADAAPLDWVDDASPHASALDDASDANTGLEGGDAPGAGITPESPSADDESIRPFEPPPPSEILSEDPIDALMAEAGRELLEGRREAARALLLNVLALDPDHVQAQKYLTRVDRELLHHYDRVLGAPEGILRLNCSKEALFELDLDEDGGFIVAEIDGSTSIEDLYNVAGHLEHLKVKRILVDLVERGVISIERPET